MNFLTTNKTLKIACKGATEVDIDGIFPLQGALKTLMEADYEKLRLSMEKYGFSDPLSIWVDETGKIWIHDGHERVLTIKKMREEGWNIPLLPASIIEAKDKTEAKEKLLANDSRYGKVTADGLTEFLNEEDSVIVESDMADILEFPEIDFDTGETEEEPKINLDKEKDTCQDCKAYHDNEHNPINPQ